MALTPYDTGERLEPKLWVSSTAGRTKDNTNDYGKVDFEDEESMTVATLHIERNEHGDYILKGEVYGNVKVEIEGLA